MAFVDDTNPMWWNELKNILPALRRKNKDGWVIEEDIEAKGQTLSRKVTLHFENKIVADMKTRCQLLLGMIGPTSKFKYPGVVFVNATGEKHWLCNEMLADASARDVEWVFEHEAADRTDEELFDTHQNGFLRLTQWGPDVVTAVTDLDDAVSAKRQTLDPGAEFDEWAFRAELSKSTCPSPFVHMPVDEMALGVVDFLHALLAFGKLCICVPVSMAIVWELDVESLLNQLSDNVFRKSVLSWYSQSKAGELPCLGINGRLALLNFIDVFEIMLQLDSLLSKSLHKALTAIWFHVCEIIICLFSLYGIQHFDDWEEEEIDLYLDLLRYLSKYALTIMSRSCLWAIIPLGMSLI